MPIHLRLLPGNLLVLSCWSPSSFGQSTEAGIEARLKNKPLYLRGCWHDADLSFDADGKLIGQSSPASFTLSGFELRSARFRKDKLRIEGKRIGLEFVKDTPKRVSLGQKVRLEIALPASGDFTPALDAIFADGLPELAPTLPSYWQHWAKSKVLPPDASAAPQGKTPTAGSARTAQAEDSTGEAAPKKVGGSVKAPRLDAHREAEFTEAARRLKYGGKALIGFIVNTDGLPDQLSVVRPAGLGLDENALVAVQSYRFTPAMQNGKPVRVEVDVEVSFQIF